MTTEQIARVAHEVNRAYCQAWGDHSQPAWEDAPDWQRTSAIKGVEFHLSKPDATPEQSHNEWLAEKRKAGWRWGPVKDPENKEHPCFMAFADLPVEQKAKDFLFRAVVRALATAEACGNVNELNRLRSWRKGVLEAMQALPIEHKAVVAKACRESKIGCFCGCHISHVMA